MLLRLTRKQRLNRIKKFATDKTSNPFVGQTLDKLATQLDNQDAKLKEVLENFRKLDLPYGIRTADLGITQAERQEDKRVEM